MGKSKGKPQVSGFSGKTIGKMLSSSGGHGAPSKSAAPKAKAKKK